MFENQEMWSEWKALGKKLMSQPEVVFANEIRVINNWYILVCKIIYKIKCGWLNSADSVPKYYVNKC